MKKHFKFISIIFIFFIVAGCGKRLSNDYFFNNKSGGYQSNIANIAGISNSTGSEVNGLTWSELKNKTVSVKDFGAVGNGVANDTVAIQKAIDFVSLLGGGDVIFPSGTYMVKDYLFAKSNVNLIGHN
uniref:glycosyl hydrolase family 28-related protein n=1 Tax=Carnobacterium maltaromaticum TaxID=2751 RepID=UPI0039AF9936